GLTPRPLRSLGRATRPKDVDGGFHVAIRFFQRALALHHSRPGPIAELFDFLRCYRHSESSPVLRLSGSRHSVVPRSSAGASPGERSIRGWPSRRRFGTPLRNGATYGFPRGPILPCLRRGSLPFALLFAASPEIR